MVLELISEIIPDAPGITGESYLRTAIKKFEERKLQTEYMIENLREEMEVNPGVDFEMDIIVAKLVIQTLQTAISDCESELQDLKRRQIAAR